MRRWVLTSLLALGWGACGSGDLPEGHVYLNDQTLSVQAGIALQSNDVVLETEGTISYTVTDKTQSATPDRFDVAVFRTENRRVIPGSQVAVQSGVSNASATTPTLTPGPYALDIACLNSVDSCVVGVTLRASF